MTHNPLEGRRSYWLRQLSPDTAEGALPGIIATMRDLGRGDCLCLKVCDGLAWQGEEDSTLAVNSVADVQAVAALCASMGVGFVPVVVPRGQDPAAEAGLHGAVAAALGCLMTDIEPYAKFWDGSPLSGIPGYVAALRQAAPEAFLINQPDPRHFGFAGAHVAETAALYDALCPQHYVGWASAGWLDVDAEVASFERIAALGRPLGVTLYGVERVDLAAAFWERVKDRALGMCVFALGAMDAQQLRAFAALDIPRPLPRDPCADLAAQLAATTAERDRLAAVVAAVRSAVT